MRVVLITAFVLLVSCYSADGFWSRRRRRSSRTVFDARVNTGGATGGIYHQGDGWSGSVTGNLDWNGNWGVNAGITIPLGKRSVTWNGNHYNVTVVANPCHFDTYDQDRDGVIVLEELQAIFGDNEKTNALFDDLDAITDDGFIQEEEFYNMASEIIGACVETDMD